MSQDALYRTRREDQQGPLLVPKRRYTDPAFAELERERLWPRAWQLACVDEQVQPLVAVYPTAWADEVLAAARGGASARSVAARCARVPCSAAELADLDQWPPDQPGPVRALLARVPWKDEVERRRIAAGEVARLAARGAVDPTWPPSTG